jgi:hypothetical protein
MSLDFLFLSTAHLTTDYMRQNTAAFMYSTRADCCEEHYSDIYDNGMGVSKVQANEWYPDWSPGMQSKDTCKKDGNAPTYVVLDPGKFVAALVSFVYERRYVDARYVT